MTTQQEAILIDTLSHDGRGIAKVTGKVTFITGALPGENVQFRQLRSQSKFQEGVILELNQPNPNRVKPKCPHFLQCGGCNLQHLSPEAQLEFKQATLLELLEHQGGVIPKTIMPPVDSKPYHYRTKARLGVKYVRKKEKVMVGFRELINPRLITDISTCAVLDESIGEKISELEALITALSIREHIPQIEVAIGENATALILRHMAPFEADDLEILKTFAKTHAFHVYLQPKGPNTIHPLYPEAPEKLNYTLPSHELTLHFRPQDFTQVNYEINRQLVDKAIELMQVETSDTVLDLFCGLGNFTLAIAKRAQHVTGVEGSAEMTALARENASMNAIDNVDFYAYDLTQPFTGLPWTKRPYDKLLLDPPRSGAKEICESIKVLGPKRIVYVSCNPATLARDAKILHSNGYKMTHAGIFNMFPNTAHVESMGCFELK